MKTILSALSLVFLFLFTACEKNPINGGYKQLGNYPTKIEAQNNGLQKLIDEFRSLPKNRDYKVSYTYPSTRTDPGSQAIWYNRGTQRLSVEVDIHSGIACWWDKVDEESLRKMAGAKRGLVGVDSLAQSTRSQSHLHCF